MDKQSFFNRAYGDGILPKVQLIADRCNVFAIIQAPTEILNDITTMCCMFEKLYHDDIYDVMYVGFENNGVYELLFNKYGEYIFEHSGSNNWYRDDDRFYLEISNVGDGRFYQIWCDTRKWLLKNINKPFDNVCWKRVGDCQYFKFKYKNDALLFKVAWF